MIVTIAICTRNRPLDLERALYSLTRVRGIEDIMETEVLIVDNSDSPQINAWVRNKFQENGFRWLWESKPGLSNARNVALENSTALWVAFLDDDAIPDANWLSALRTNIHQPGLGVIGGTINPIWPYNEEPEWVPRSLREAYTILDRYKKSFVMADDGFVYGANFAVLRSAALDAGGFNSELGRSGESLLSGEEISIQNAIRRSGYKVFFESEMVISHIIDPIRVKPAWLIRRIAWEGMTDGKFGSEISVEAVQMAAQKHGFANLMKLITNSDLTESEVEDYSLIQRFLIHRILNAPINGNPLPAKVNDQSVSGIYFETKTGHTNLLETETSPGDSISSVARTDLWIGSILDAKQTIQYWLQSIIANPEAQKLIYLTLDPWLAPHLTPLFLSHIDLLAAKNVILILHRPPWSRQGLESLRKISKKSNVRIFTFSRNLAEKIAFEEIAIQFTPHPITFDCYFVSKERELKTSEISKVHRRDSVLGELRTAKLPDLVIDAARIIRMKQEDFDLKCVGAAPTSKILSKLIAFGANVEEVSLRGETHMVAPITSLAAAANSSDFGFVFQSQEESMAASGILQLWAAARKPVIALKGTEVGRIVEQFQIGIVVDPVAQTIAEAALKLMEKTVNFPIENFEEFLNESGKCWSYIFDNKSMES